jgi:hypothetical protein
MKAVEFQGQSVVLNPPKGWDNGGDTAQCGALPIQLQDQDGMPVMRSAWRPSQEEILALLEGAHICVGIVGTAHPPIQVYVEKVEELP